MQQLLLVALHLQMLRQRTILTHVTTLLPLLPIMATTMWPYPPHQIAPKASMGLLQLYRRLAEVRMKPGLYHRPVVRQQGLKGVPTVRSHTGPRIVLEVVMDNLPEIGTGIECTLTGAETGTGTTGVGAKSMQVTVIASGTDGTTVTSTILDLTEIDLLKAVLTGIGSLIVTGNGLSTTPGIVTVTDTATVPETTGAVSGGDTVIPTMRGLIDAGSGKRSIETPR